MEQLKRQLESLAKNLKVLTLKSEKIAKKLASLEKARTPKRQKVKAKVQRKKVARRPAKKVARRPAKKVARRPAKKVARRPAKKVARRPAKKVAKRPTKVTAIDTVLKIIQNRKKGITTDEIKKRTGFKEKKIWDIINRAKRQGKVKSLGKGVYVKG